MNTNKPYQDDPSNMDAWVNDRLEAYLDNQLPSEEAMKVEKWLEGSDHWHEELTLAMHIRDELRGLRLPDCPPHLSQNIIRAARQDVWRSFTHRLNQFFLGGWISYWKPILATLTLLIITSVIVFNVPRPIETPSENISQVDVDQALNEVKWTLGYVSKTGRLTGESVEDVLGPLLKDLPKE